MSKVGGKIHEPIVATLDVNVQQLPMEVDIGTAVSMIYLQLEKTSSTHVSLTALHWRSNACGRRYKVESRMQNCLYIW